MSNNTHSPASAEAHNTAIAQSSTILSVKDLTMQFGGLIAVNGVSLKVGDGQIVFIPAGMSHEFLNPFDEPAEFLLFMFGEGA